MNECFLCKYARAWRSIGKQREGKGNRVAKEWIVDGWLGGEWKRVEKQVMVAIVVDQYVIGQEVAW